MKTALSEGRWPTMASAQQICAADSQEPEVRKRFSVVHHPQIWRRHWAAVPPQQANHSHRALRLPLLPRPRSLEPDLATSQAVSYAQIISTTAAAAGLLINAYQTWRSRKAVTLQHLQDFLDAMNDRESALAEHNDDRAKQLHAFVEFLNFLEIYSAAVNADLFVGVAREIVVEKLVDSIALLFVSRDWHDEIKRSITSQTTYKHIRRFVSAHAGAIEAQKRALQPVGKST